VLAYSHVFDFWGQSGSLAFVAPYAWASVTGNVFEVHDKVDRTGFSDLTLRLNVNLYGAPALDLHDFAAYHQDVIVGVTLVVSSPTGQYIDSKLINIGTNRWSFHPEVGVSKRLGAWTLESALGVTLYTDNTEYFGDHVRHQEPLYSLQGHVIYNFTPKLWGSVDGTYYTGGRTTLDGSLNNDLERDSRWGSTLAYTLARHNSIKLYFSSGLTDSRGTNFKIYGIAFQTRWGAGL
jgi:hypothetical protein